MSALIISSASPYTGLADATGTFALDDVLPGPFTLTAYAGTHKLNADVDICRPAHGSDCQQVMRNPAACGVSGLPFRTTPKAYATRRSVLEPRATRNRGAVEVAPQRDIAFDNASVAVNRRVHGVGLRGR